MSIESKKISADVILDPIMVEEYLTTKGRRSVEFDGQTGTFVRVAERPIFYKDEASEVNRNFGCEGGEWAPIVKISASITQDPEVFRTTMESYLNEEIGFYPDLGIFAPFRAKLQEGHQQVYLPGHF